jgi:hypothetical protein
METAGKKIRVLIAKTSLDGHWRGVVTVAAAFRNAGMEVVYAGQATAEQILQTALQEDVDRTEAPGCGRGLSVRLENQRHRSFCAGKRHPQIRS